MKYSIHKKKNRDVFEKLETVSTAHSPALKIGVSGKRHISDTEKNKVYREIKERIHEILREHGIVKFTGYSAMATGADTIFAEVVKNEFKQPLHIILPFDSEEYKKDFEGDDLQVFEHFIEENGIYELAQDVVPRDHDARNIAYFEAGKKIVDKCDDMVIVWDELKPGGAGGTAEILGYLARKKDSKQISYIKIKPAKADPLHGMLMAGFRKANKLAMRARDRYKWVWKGAIILGWMTVLCFALKTAYHIEGTNGLILTCFEFLFVCVAYILIYFARKKNYHGHYLKERLKAEKFRLLHCFYHTDVDVEISDESREQKTSLAAAAEKINQHLEPAERKSKWYTQYVIRSLIHEQCRYHENKVKSIGSKHHLLETLNKIIGAIFLINLAAHLIYLFLEPENAQHSSLHALSVFFNILLPASYAAIEGFIYFNAWALLKKHSESAKQGLTEVEGMLPADLEKCDFENCHDRQAKVLHHVSRIMLTDNQSWNLLLENKDNYHMIV